MASRTPTGAGLEGLEDGEGRDYLLGWAALRRLLEDGHSWSGHERNTCHVSLGDGRFVDGSVASGLDFADDGRAVAVVDWDADGDLDLWLKNRTGPQLRFMQNTVPPSGETLQLRLEGTSSNRDAIGARVELHADGRVRSRSVRAGEGYLAQSSRWLTFHLAPGESIDRLRVRWPGGSVQEIVPPTGEGRYRVVQGRDEPIPAPSPSAWLAPAPAEATGGPGSGTAAVLLKEPLPLPPSILRLARDAPGAESVQLVNLWAHWCKPCLEELGGLAEGYDELRAAGIEVVALSVDPPEDREASDRAFAEKIAARMGDERFTSRPVDETGLEVLDAVLRHVLGDHDELVLPTSLLVDERGRLQVIYLGPVERADLMRDVGAVIGEEPHPPFRRSFFGGRWYFRTPRPIDRLAADLRARGLREDARFYYSVLQLRGKAK